MWHLSTFNGVSQRFSRILLLGRPTGRPKGLKLYPWTLLFFFFYQSTVLSSRTVDGHQMYFEGSVVGKASTVGREISPTSPLIFTGSQQLRNLASFKTSINFGPLAFEKCSKILEFWKSAMLRWSHMSWPHLVKLGSRTPEKAPSLVTHPLKLHAKIWWMMTHQFAMRRFFIHFRP